MDSPFIGPTYPLRSKPASVQRTVNLMPVPIEPGNERAGWILKDVHGLVLFAQTVPPLYFTSWPYPLFADEAMNADLSVPRGGQLWFPPLEQTNADLSIPLSGTLVTQAFQLYNNFVADKLWADLSTPQSGTLDVVLNFYGNALPDATNADLSIPLAGTLLVILVSYTNAPADKLWADLSIPLSGTLV